MLPIDTPPARRVLAAAGAALAGLAAAAMFASPATAAGDTLGPPPFTVTVEQSCDPATGTETVTYHVTQPTDQNQTHIKATSNVDNGGDVAPASSPQNEFPVTVRPGVTGDFTDTIAAIRPDKTATRPVSQLVLTSFPGADKRYDDVTTPLVQFSCTGPASPGAGAGGAAAPGLTVTALRVVAFVGVGLVLLAAAGGGLVLVIVRRRKATTIV